MMPTLTTSIEKIAAAEAFHHGDAHAQPLAGLVQPLPVGIHVGKRMGIGFVRPKIVHVLARGLQVVARIDREHQNLDPALLDRALRNERIVARKPDVTDASLGFQRSRII